MKRFPILIGIITGILICLINPHKEVLVQAQGTTGGWQYKHISANAATTILGTSPGTLVAVVINTKGSSSNVLTVYDNATACSGTVIATLDTTSSVGAVEYNLATTKGLCVALATGTAADLTVTYQ